MAPMPALVLALLVCFGMILLIEVPFDTFQLCLDIHLPPAVHVTLGACPAVCTCGCSVSLIYTCGTRNLVDIPSCVGADATQL